MPPAGFASAGESIDHFLNFRGPEEGTLTVNFNISLQKDDGSPIEVAPRRVRQIMRLLLTNYVHLEEGQTVIDGKRCYYCSATFDWKGQRCRNLQYYLRGGNGMLYIVTFASLEATFARHRTDFERAALTARTD